jgi:hypothetical protein
LAASQLQDRLQSLASASGLDVLTTVSLRDEPAGEFRKTTVQMTLRGGLAELGRFVAEEMELAPRGSWGNLRTLKAIPITPAVRARLAIDAATASLTPAELIRAILRAPVDVLWNGKSISPLGTRGQVLTIKITPQDFEIVPPPQPKQEL